MLLNEQLPAQLARHPDAAKQIGGKFQLNINGDGGGGEWFIDASDTGPKVRLGNPGTADVTITIAAEDFQKYLENPQANGMQLLFSGKLRMSGNQMLAMRLSKLFSVGS